MEPFAEKRLGRTDVMLPRLGFGGAGLGHTFASISETQAADTVASAWQAGIRYFDTSPWYGRGLSERRIGTSLHLKPRDQLILSTKVGRLFTAPADPSAFALSERSWPQGLHFEHHHDYSYGGVMRSYEDSLQRLGMNRVDLLIIHDLDRTSLMSDALVSSHLGVLATGGMRALAELKSAGLIRAVGVGVNQLGTIPLFLNQLDLDFFLVALPYTLAEQHVLDLEFPLCAERGVGIIVGAPFASGILATGSMPGAKLNYRNPTDDETRRINQIEAVCRSYGVSIAAAALQFPLLHPLVASVTPGAIAPSHVERTIEAMRVEIPGAMWGALKSKELLREDAPTSL